MQNIDSNPTKIVLNNYDSPIEKVNWEELEKNINEFNEGIQIFQIPSNENIYRIDKKKIKLLLENADKIPKNLGNIDLSDLNNFLTINLPDFNEKGYDKISKINIFENDDTITFDMLKLPFQLEDLDKKIENCNNEIEDLNGLIEMLIVQENELRNKRNDPAKLKETLDFLIMSQRKLKLKLKHMCSMILIKYSADLSNEDLLPEYQKLDSKIEAIPVMLFAGMPSF